MNFAQTYVTVLFLIGKEQLSVNDFGTDSTNVLALETSSIINLKALHGNRKPIGLIHIHNLLKVGC